MLAAKKPVFPQLGVGSGVGAPKLSKQVGTALTAFAIGLAVCLGAIAAPPTPGASPAGMSVADEAYSRTVGDDGGAYTLTDAGDYVVTNGSA